MKQVHNYVKSNEELVEKIKTLSNNDNTKLIGQKGLKYVNSLMISLPIINKINTFLNFSTIAFIFYNI